MFLARRVQGQRIWVYPVVLPRYLNPIAWSFEPKLNCALVRQELSGPGFCALAMTFSEAREAFIKAEERYG